MHRILQRGRRFFNPPPQLVTAFSGSAAFHAFPSHGVESPHVREITNTREVKNDFDKYHVKGLSRCLNWTSRSNANSQASCYVVNRHFASDCNDICSKEFSSKVQLILSISFFLFVMYFNLNMLLSKEDNACLT